MNNLYQWGYSPTSTIENPNIETIRHFLDRKSSQTGFIDSEEWALGFLTQYKNIHAGFDFFIGTQTEFESYRRALPILTLVGNGQENNLGTVFFQSVFRRAVNLLDKFYETTAWADGTPRNRKQIQNSITGIDVDFHYIILKKKTDPDYIPLQDGLFDKYLKDTFIIEENYISNKNAEFRRLTQMLDGYKVVEEHYEGSSAPITQLITDLINIHLPNHVTDTGNPIGSIDLGALVSGGTTTK